MGTIQEEGGEIQARGWEAQRPGRTCFLSIMWRRAIESEKTGQQQPSRKSPTGDPLHIVAGSTQHIFGTSARGGAAPRQELRVV